MKKVSDLIFEFLSTQGVTHIFLISGGGNIHLVDSLGRSGIRYVCNHHEQACAIAAESYARLTGNIGVALVTTGPGGTNAITGVAGAFLDSISTLTISGQVRTEIMGTPLGMRQLGPQEIDIVSIVKPITKYAVTITNPYEVLYHLEKALYIAKDGRPGPVWLDIPLDIQGAHIDPRKMKHFIPKSNSNTRGMDNTLTKIVQTVIDKLRASERPVLYAGHGIRLSGAHKDFLTLVDLLHIPVLTSYVGYDMLPNSHPYFFGRAHSLGQRAANFIVQNSDVLLAIGARLDVLTTGFTYKAYAREAYKIMVDTDNRELTKHTLSIDLPVQCDANLFIREMIRQLRRKPLSLHIERWLSYGRNTISEFSNVPADAKSEKRFVNPYYFIDVIGRKYLKPNEIIVESDGVGPLNCMYQAFYVKSGQRIILNLGCAQMGYGLPAAIGVAFAAGGKKRIICFEGDGSLQLNIQELQVVKHHNLPIKLFVYSNDGYLSIRNTQKGLFGGRLYATDASSGVSVPDFVKVARAYGIHAIRIHNHKDMERKIRYALSYPGPILVDIHASRNLVLTPKLQTKKTEDGRFVSPPLEDMAPFLSESELRKYMLIPLWQEIK